MASISSMSTPTPQSRQSKLSQVPHFATSDNFYEFQQTFCRYVHDMDQKDPEGKMEDAERAKLLEGVEPSQGLLEWADQLIKDLQAIEIQRQAQIEAMCDQLINLWKRLDVEVEDMESFMERHKGVTEECVLAYEGELESMMALKRERMGQFVENAREEIRSLWDGLMMSEAERKEFAPFIDSSLSHSILFNLTDSSFFLILADYTEDLLTNHEEEIRRLKEDRELKEGLLGKVKKYFEICDEQKELEKAAGDQGRLMGRGHREPGRLLREEKMRKRVTRDKPKVCRDFV